MQTIVTEFKKIINATVLHFYAFLGGGAEDPIV